MLVPQVSVLEECERLMPRCDWPVTEPEGKRLLFHDVCKERVGSCGNDHGSAMALALVSEAL